MSIDLELIRRGVIVPTFKTKQNNILTYTFKGRYYLNYLKARAKASAKAGARSMQAWIPDL